MGNGFNSGAIPQANGGVGAGGYYGQVNLSGYVDPNKASLEQFKHVNDTIQGATDSLVKKQALEVQKAKAQQDMALDQQRIDLAKENQQLQVSKMAADQKQQEIDNELNQKKSAREDLKYQLDLAEFNKKDQLSTLIRDNMPTVLDTIDSGSYEDLKSNEGFKTTVAAITALDPSAGFKITNDLLTKKAKQDDDQKAAATYEIASKVYLDKMPSVIDSLDKGKSLTEAMDPIKQSLIPLYKSGNLDYKALNEQLKHATDLALTYNKNKDSKAKEKLVSYDDQGNTSKTTINDKDGVQHSVTSDDIKNGFVMVGPRKITFKPNQVNYQDLSPQDIAYQVNPETNKVLRVPKPKAQGNDFLTTLNSLKTK